MAERASVREARKMVASGRCDYALRLLKAGRNAPKPSDAWAERIVDAVKRLGLTEVDVGLNPNTFEPLLTEQARDLALRVKGAFRRARMYDYEVEQKVGSVMVRRVR